MINNFTLKKWSHEQKWSHQTSQTFFKSFYNFGLLCMFLKLKSIHVLYSCYLGQLEQIYKSSMARLLCDTSDRIEEIQRWALKSIRDHEYVYFIILSKAA